MSAAPGPRAVGHRSLLSLPSALSAVARIGGYERLVLFLDYDGTLTPIATRPDQAALAGQTAALVQALAAHGPVAIVSGRDRPDVERLVGLPALSYAGSHGFDIAGPGGPAGRYEPALDYLGDLALAEDRLRPLLRSITGAWVERKRFALAVHYREVHETSHRAVADVVAGVATATRRLRLRTGKNLYELQPAIEWDKGRAVLWLLERLVPASGQAHPLYIGDDETDEDAFRALRGRGTGIAVGDRDRVTAAEYALRSPDDVHRFLRDLLAVRAAAYR